MGDDGYLQAMTSHLPRVIEAIKPQLVFYQAGVDPLQSDRLGERENEIMPSSAMQFSWGTVDCLPKHALDKHIRQVGSQVGSRCHVRACSGETIWSMSCCAQASQTAPAVLLKTYDHKNVSLRLSIGRFPDSIQPSCFAKTS